MGLSKNIDNWVAAQQNFEYYQAENNEELHGYNVQRYARHALQQDLRNPQIKAYSKTQYLVATSLPPYVQNYEKAYHRPALVRRHVLSVDTEGSHLLP